ncbi:MAG: nucleotidyltransferase domain-containing protein [Patescibacteria group bacterium]
MALTQIEEISQKIKPIAEKYNMELILLFGSRATTHFRKDSDFDVAYYANKELSFEERSGLYCELSELLESDRIDLLDVKTIKPLIFYEIMKNCRVLYAESILKFYELRVYAFNRFQDEVKSLFQFKFDRLKAKYL